MRDLAAARRAKSLLDDPVRRVAPGKTTLRESTDDATKTKNARGPKGSVFSTFKATELAQEATRGTGDTLPHLDRIQLSFGRHDVQGVRAHVGGAAADAADALDAHAYAVGDAIGFASAPDLRRAAHEAAHVVQQRSGVALDHGMDRGKADPYEQHADAVADAVVAGQSAEALLDAGPAGGGETLGVQRDSREQLDGNPGEDRDAAGNETTEHRDPTMADTADHAELPEVHDTPLAARSFVRIRRSRENPLELEPTARPNFVDDLYTTTSTPVVGYAPFDAFHGTITHPIVEEMATPGLYIGQGPSPDDVDQGALGDCYFMATLMSVAQRDPAKIRSIMSPDGRGGATVRLWRRNKHEKNFFENLLPFLGAPEFDFTPVDVHVSGELQCSKGGGIRGAQLRAGDEPISTDWWAALAGSRLELHRRDLYEVARWAPLMEKAYARIAQQWGQYANAPEQGPNARNGYQVIGNGGYPLATMIPLYGPELAEQSAGEKYDQISWSAQVNSGAALLFANQPVIDQLCRLAGRGHEPAEGEADAPIMTTVAMTDDFARRLGSAVQAALVDPAFAQIDPDHQQALRAVSDAWTAWNNVSDNAPGAWDVFDALCKACGNATFDGPVGGEAIAKVNTTNPGTVTFAPFHSELDQEQQSKVMSLGTMLAVHAAPAMNVTITGHTTTREPAELSQARADAVAAGLSHGVQLASPTGTQLVHNEHPVHAMGIGAERATAEPTWCRAEINVDAANAQNRLHVSSSPVIQAAMDLMLDLRAMSSDPRSSQKNIIGDHVYSVVGAWFVDGSYQQVPLQSTPSEQRSKLFPRVDTKLSSVRVRNPHHGNEPDRLGNDHGARSEDGAPAGAASDGMFTLTLEQFLRNFSGVGSAVLRRSR